MDPEKRKWFSEVLDTMKAGDEMQYLAEASVQDYTTYWVQQVDRGGLYRIDNKVSSSLTLTPTVQSCL
jgi:hypothetical protein